MKQTIIQLTPVELYLHSQLGYLDDLDDDTLVVKTHFDDIVDEYKYDHIVLLKELIDQYIEDQEDTKKHIPKEDNKKLPWE